MKGRSGMLVRSSATYGTKNIGAAEDSQDPGSKR